MPVNFEGCEVFSTLLREFRTQRSGGWVASTRPQHNEIITETKIQKIIQTTKHIEKIYIYM